MNIEDIMTTRVVKVKMDDDLETIRQVFQGSRFHHLLVVEESKLIGVISDRDLLKNLSPFISTFAERPQDLDTLDKKAHQVMTREPVTATKGTPLQEAAELLVQHGISCLPVVSSDGRIKGIVTWKDILKWSVKESSGKSH